MRTLTGKLLGKRKGHMAAFLACAAMAAFLTMATALSVTDFLSLLFGQPTAASNPLATTATPLTKLIDSVYESLASHGAAKALVLYSVLLVVVYGCKNVFSYLSSLAFAKIRVSVLYDLRQLVHRSLMSTNFALWGSQKQGQWLSAMTNDVAEYDANVLESIKMLVSSALTMAIYILMLLYIDWSLTLIVASVMLVGTLLLSVSRRLKRQSRELQNLNGELMTTTQETIDSIKEIKAATAIDYVNDRQRVQNAHFTRRRIALYRRIYAASPISDFVGNIIVAVILIIGASRVMGADATMTASLFVSYIMIYVLLLTPIKDFSNSLALIKKGRGVEERLSTLVGDSSTHTEEGCRKGSRETINSIMLRGVSFGYGSHRVIDGLSWEVPMHSHIAVTGESGSGKTTLARLLVGLMDCQEGSILLNGQATNAGDRAGRIAYVPQQPMLFNDTVRENVRFGREWLTDSDIDEALRAAQADTLVSALPEGLDTPLGDGGGKLSGGERQRISIARALAGHPDVIVMDEATAALDAGTENRFTSALRHLLTDTTVIVIAHRVSTIESCDTVFNIATA